jgi:hypothetical protein
MYHLFSCTTYYILCRPTKLKLCAVFSEVAVYSETRAKEVRCRQKVELLVVHEVTTGRERVNFFAFCGRY